MFKLISATNVMPSSLFIADIKTDRDAITMGGPGQIFDGVHGGRHVALKVLYKGHHKEVRQLLFQLFQHLFLWIGFVPRRFL